MVLVLSFAGSLLVLFLFFAGTFWLANRAADNATSPKERRKSKRTQEYLDESVKIFRLIKTNVDAYLPSEINERIDTLLEKVKKEYE